MRPILRMRRSRLRVSKENECSRQNYGAMPDCSLGEQKQYETQKNSSESPCKPHFRPFNQQTMAGGKHQAGCEGIGNSHPPAGQLPNERKREVPISVATALILAVRRRVQTLMSNIEVCCSALKRCLCLHLRLCSSFGHSAAEFQLHHRSLN